MVKKYLVSDRFGFLGRVFSGVFNNSVQAFYFILLEINN